jgi:hypothetical protein
MAGPLQSQPEQTFDVRPDHLIQTRNTVPTVAESRSIKGKANLQAFMTLFRSGSGNSEVLNQPKPGPVHDAHYQ